MTKKKYLHTLIAVVLLAAVWGVFTYYDKHKASEKPKTEPTKQEKIFSVDAQHIQTIAFKPKDGEAFTCQREGGNWVISQPHHLAADQSSLSGLLNSLSTATMDDVIDPHPANLKDFGLDPPAFTLDVTTDAKPASFTLLLGDDTPTSGGVYAQVGGNPRVFTLASYEKTSLEKKLFDLRDRRALTLDADQLQKIGVQYKNTNWTLEKNPEGVWDLNLPPAVRADRFTADGLVSQLRGLTMQTIPSEDKKKGGDYGLGSPEVRIDLTASSGKQTLIIGKKDKEGDRYFATNSALEPVFTLNSSFVTQFEKNPGDMREKDLFSFSSFDAKHVDVTTPKGHWVFDKQTVPKQADQWKQATPSAKNVNSDKLETLLSKLRDLRADSFPKDTNLAKVGLDKPQYKFSVQSGEKNNTETVEAAKSGDHVYARRATDTVPSELSKTALDDIDKALGEL